MNYYRKNKYNANQTKRFDSSKEENRYQQLLRMERAGKISNLKRQVKFVLIPEQREKSREFFTRGAQKGQPKPGKLIEKECAYIADFTYNDEDGNFIVEDVKGYKGGEAYRTYVIKRKLMLLNYGVRIKET